MRVEILERDSYYKLQKDINEILQNYKNDEIIDIRYNRMGYHLNYGTQDFCSAMIIFK